jgi:folate-binding protein YgfZ
MSVQWNSVVLESWGVLRARGADVTTFLQGQVSNDVTLLGAETSLLAGYHNPQGRAIALLRLVQLAADDVLAVLPRELVSVVAARLAKFILRAKVKLADESSLWRLEGVLASEAVSGAADPYAALLPAAPGGVHRLEDYRIVRLGASPARLLLVRPASAATLSALGARAPLSVAAWQLGAIAAGEPQVYAATSEEFLAQMLNLDALNAIAFDKGCYTGQEVIARAHYRGRVKRRMQRFVTEAAAALKPGDVAELADGRAFRVVEAAQHADGRCEFLAVAAMDAGDATPGDAHAGATSGKTVIRATPLALPYALPQ